MSNHDELYDGPMILSDEDDQQSLSSSPFVTEMHSTRIIFFIQTDVESSPFDITFTDSNNETIITVPRWSSNEFGEINVETRSGPAIITATRLRDSVTVSREFNIGPSEPYDYDCENAPHVSPQELLAITDPIPYLPHHLCKRFTMDGRIKFVDWYYDQSTSHTYRKRERREIDEFLEGTRLSQTYYYGITDTWMYEALAAFPIAGKKVLIMGSNVPWYESMCVTHGAALCLTVEYNEVHYDHPEMRTITVQDFEALDESEVSAPQFIPPFFSNSSDISPPLFALLIFSFSSSSLFSFFLKFSEFTSSTLFGV
jgi:hypothetical protein